jgi:hypothetical protein
MEFEEMQKIWDSQNNETLYAINEKSLHNSIKQKGRNINKYVMFFEWAMIVSTLFVALALTIDTITEAGSWPRCCSRARACASKTASTKTCFFSEASQPSQPRPRA